MKHSWKNVKEIRIKCIESMNSHSEREKTTYCEITCQGYKEKQLNTADNNRKRL